MIRESNDNALFTTEQCNNHCIMCCQPPKQIDDIEFYMQRNLGLIKQLPEETPVVCLTGGEPTLLGNQLFFLIDRIREQHPDIAIHILSNGRNFKDATLVRTLKEHAGDNIFIGVPMHSDYHRDHDMIAGAKGAFNETIQGLYNLAAGDIEIELRIVMNRLNYRRFPQIAEFIYKNLPFVSWVAFMAIEDCGLAIKNRDRIWIEPTEYIKELTQAVQSLSRSAMDVAIYNVPLCLLPLDLHPFAAQSISAWKVKFLDQCHGCLVKENCCGLFATSDSIFQGIAPITEINSSL